MLNRIVAEIRKTVAVAKATSPIDAGALPPAEFKLSKILQESPWSLIAECKLASPAKGRLCNSHTVPELAQVYSAHGAAALSVHTSAPFLGHITDIGAVRSVSALPLLRKDFIIDAHQIYEARAAGADAVLLIAAILTDAELMQYLQLCHRFGMDALVEVHSRQELARALATPAAIIGINNRDLTTFATSVETTFELLPHCGPGRLVISESGITGAGDALRLKAAGVKGILVGEALVLSSDIAGKTAELALLQQGLEE